ncbi:MAG: c-type cytochrome [Nitrospinae bacterium]|nr:c-type cytochrome [Nitrospinota bacterium]
MNKIVRLKIGRILFSGLILMAISLPATVFAQEAQPPDVVKTELLEQGKQVYFKRCVWCHGVEGGGDGPSADRLFTRPRNFIQGTFKIRFTDSGELPLEEDLIRTVTNGLPGSAMPAWGGFLKPKEIEAVVEFVKTLVQDRDFNDVEDEEVFVQEFGSNPWGTKEPYHLGVPQEAIDQGKKIFLKNKCFECHGGEGRGDGNPTMKDDWGFPIVAADWQQCWNFRGSRRNHFDPFNIVRTISTGMNGTPMPNFKDEITVEDRWKLAAFVNSLCPRKKMDRLTNKPIADFLISSLYTEGKIAEKIDAPMWAATDHDPLIVDRSAETIDNPRKNYIAMAGQITRGNRNFDPKTDNLWVASRWSAEDNVIFYLVEYHIRFLSTDPEYPDAVAIQWPAKLQDLFGAEKPYFIMGDSKKPVDIWKASFMVQNYRDTNDPKDEGYQLDVTVEEVVGYGFDALASKESEATVQVVDSIFKQGKVSILFKRSLTTEGEFDVQIPSEKFIPVAFLQWSGQHKEKDEYMAISTWYYTILVPPLPDSLYYMPPIMAVVFIGLQGWLVWMTKRTRKMFEEGKARRDFIPDKE